MNGTTGSTIGQRRSELAARIAVAHHSGFNIGVARRFAAAGFGPEALLKADTSSVANALSLRRGVIDAMRRGDIFERADREVDFIEANDITPLWYTDPDFPALLQECDDAPAMVFVLGKPVSAEHKIVSIVGTRHCTAYGRSFIDRLVADLASSVSNLYIVSGLALGADIAAHRAALKNGLLTGAVMAEGLNRVYPAEHRSDAMRIVREGGMLMTSYLSSDTTTKGNFLARNKIVAGMAELTVVVESDLKGGAMSTARLANGYNREVLALPGRVTDQYSRGCNALIAAHTAHIIRDASDLIELAGWTPDKKPGVQTTLMPELTSAQEELLSFLRMHPEATVNDLAVAMDLPFRQVSATLFELEMDGLVAALPGGRYMTV